MKYTWLLLLLLAGCEQKPENEYTDFIFQIPLQISARDTVAVGDTIWVTANFSDRLRELYNGNTYAVTPQNFELRTLLGVRQLVYPNKGGADQPAATNDFIFFNKIGSLTQRGTTFSPLTYEYANEQYNLRIGMIPQKRGVFCVNLLDGWQVSSGLDKSVPDISYLLSGRTAEGGKRYAVFSGVLYYINEGRTNFHIFKEHCFASSIVNNTSIGNVTYEQKGTFTFVVK